MQNIYACTECGKYVYEDNTVWVDPETREATVANGKPYHLRCAPPRLPTVDEWIADHAEWVNVVGDARGRLSAVWAFAQGLHKLDHFLRMLERACFPTWFGEPAKTILMTDFAPHSFYFEVYPRDPRYKGNFLMNGGLIFHESSDGGEWSIHT